MKTKELLKALENAKITMDDLKVALSIKTKVLNDLNIENLNDVDKLVDNLKDSNEYITLNDVLLCINGVNSKELANMFNTSEGHINECKRVGLNGYIFNDDINVYALWDLYVKKTTINTQRPDAYVQPKQTKKALYNAIVSKVEYNETIEIKTGFTIENENFMVKVLKIIQPQKTIIIHVDMTNKQKNITLENQTLTTQQFSELYNKVNNAKTKSYKFIVDKTNVLDSFF